VCLPDHVFYDATGQKLALKQYLQTGLGTELYLGKQHHFKVRLVVLKVPKAVREQRLQRLHKEAKRKGRRVCTLAIQLATWDVRITNAPLAALVQAEAFTLLRALTSPPMRCDTVYKNYLALPLRVLLCNDDVPNLPSNSWSIFMLT
jgi:hypothetical protein